MKWEKWTAYLPIVKVCYCDIVGNVLQKNNIRPLFGTCTKIRNLLKNTKDPLTASYVASEYEIFCSYGLSWYTGQQTGKAINIRLKEYLGWLGGTNEMSRTPYGHKSFFEFREGMHFGRNKYVKRKILKF